MKLVVPLFALALTAPALAQSTVAVYGTVDVYGQYLDGHTRSMRIQSGGLNSSRLGFRGREDLGGGLYAFFTLESGINVDDGTTAQGGILFGRQALVGLQTPYGTLSVGRQYGSLHAAVTELSVFMTQPAGPSTAVIGGFGGGYEPVRGASNTAVPPAAGATGNGGPVRVNNSIRYESPAWNGLKATVLYGAGEVVGGTNEARLLDVGLRYTSGNIDLVLSHVDDRATGARVTNAATTALAASYSFRPFRVVAGVVDFNDKGTADEDGRGFWVGAEYRIQSHVLKTQFVQNKPRFGSDNRTNAYGIGYVYELSKRTALYSSLTRFDNDGAAGTSGLGRTNGTIPAGVTKAGSNSVNELVWGVRHSF